MMRTSFSKLTPLWLLLALAATPTIGQTSSLSDCPLDPGFVDLERRCGRNVRDLAPDDCAAVRLFERLARDERTAALEILDQDFGYPESHRDDVMPWLTLFAKSALDPDGPEECTTAQAEIVLGIGPGMMQGKPQALVFLLRVLGWPDTLLERLEERQPDKDATEASKRLALPFRRILLSTKAGKTALDGLNENPLVGMLAGQTPAPPPVEAEGDKPMHRVDRAVRLAQEGNPDQMRQAMSQALELAADPAEKAKMLTRAGISLLVADSPEDAIDYLLQANTLLEGGTTEDPATKILHALTKHSLAMAHRKLGLPQETQFLEAARTLADGHLGKALEAVGESFVHQDASQLSLLTKMILSGELSKDELEPLMEVLGTVVPGLDLDYLKNLASGIGESAEETAYLPEMLRMMEHISLERYAEAAQVAKQLIRDYPRSNSIYFLAVIAGKQFQAGDYEEALDNSREAVKALEKRIETFRVDEVQTAVVDQESYLIFRLALEMAGEANRVEEAFDYAERGRAWTLRRLLGGSLQGSAPSGPSEEEKETLEDIRGLEAALRAAAEAGQEELEKKLAAKRDEFATHRLARKLGHADENPLAQVKPVTLDQLRTQILPPQTTLLVYAEGSDDLWAWVIDRESVEMVLLPFPEDQRTLELTDTIRGMSHRGVRPLGAPVDESLRTLYSRLIEPLAQHLKHQNLIIVPHGALHHLPFAALRNTSTGAYLVEEFTLSVAPSATALRQVLRPSAAPMNGEPLVLGDPVTELEALRGARDEAKAVAELLGTEPRLGKEATKTTVLDQAESVGLLHLAAHGEYMSGNPIFSWIWLSSDDGRDGLVEMHEVWDHWDLPNARLVTLSGCQTALGELTRGDEVLGLTQAFLVAGSRAVLSTLWSVEDKASEKLIVAFYGRLLDGMTAAEALRAAQRKLMQEYDDPFYWAGYTLTGDPRIRWQAVKPPVREDAAKVQTGVPSTTPPSPPEPRRRPTVLGSVLASFLVGLVALGFFMPPQFPPRLGVVLSPEEDMDEGHFHHIGSARRFFRSARVYVSADRLQDRASGALARLRAGRRSVLIQPIGGHTLWQEDRDGEWKPLAPREHRVQIGAVYSDERRTTFFQLRRR